MFNKFILFRRITVHFPSCYQKKNNFTKDYHKCSKRLGKMVNNSSKMGPRVRRFYPNAFHCYLLLHWYAPDSWPWRAYSATAREAWGTTCRPPVDWSPRSQWSPPLWWRWCCDSRICIRNVDRILVLCPWFCRPTERNLDLESYKVNSERILTLGRITESQSHLFGGTLSMIKIFSESSCVLFITDRMLGQMHLQRLSS